MFLLDRMLKGGLEFVLRRVADIVDAEMNDPRHLHEELLAAQMRLELGEITEGEFESIERALLDRLRAIEERRRAERGDDPRGPDDAPVVAAPTIEIEADVGGEPKSPPRSDPAPRKARKRSSGTRKARDSRKR